MYYFLGFCKNTKKLTNLPPFTPIFEQKTFFTPWRCPRAIPPNGDLFNLAHKCK